MRKLIFILAFALISSFAFASNEGNGMKCIDNNMDSPLFEKNQIRPIVSDYVQKYIQKIEPIQTINESPNNQVVNTDCGAIASGASTAAKLLGASDKTANAIYWAVYISCSLMAP